MKHIKHAVNGLVALVAVVAFTIVVPAGLIAYVGWPLPASIPSLDEIQLALRSGIDPDLIINTLAIVVWIVWTQLIVVLTAETIAAVQGRAASRLPVVPGLQPAVAQLVAAITLAVTVLGPLRAAPAAAGPLPTQLSQASVYPVLDVEQQQWQHQEEVAQPSAAVANPTYRVERHDTLWSIAEGTLGSGRRWVDIRTLNAGRTMNDGQQFTEATDLLSPGWQLVLPADATLDNTEVPEEAATEVTVQPGDHLWSIAKTALTGAWGRSPSDHEITEYWHQLVKVNRDRLAPPHDPDLIYPDQTFELPPAPSDRQAQPAPSPQSEPAGHDEVEVDPGDTFWSIAETALSDDWDRPPTTSEVTVYWESLIDSNLDRLAPPHDPDLVFPGQVFVLPPIPTDPDSAVGSGTGQVTPMPEPPLLPPEPAEPTSEPNLIPTPTVPTPTPTTVTSAPAPADVTPATVAVADDATADDATAKGGLLGEMFPIAAKLAGLGILATGIVALLRRLRATQVRQRRPGTIPTPPPSVTAATETMIRKAAAPTATDFIDVALRAMAHDVIESHLTPPHVVGAHLTADTLRLLLWTPHTNPPPGWHIDDDGRSWTLPATTDISLLQRKASGVAAPYPALVTVGHRDDAQLLLDLEFLGATQVTGEPADVVDTCVTIATELATTPLADGIQIICVGFGADLGQLERITVIDDLTETLPAIEAKAAAVAAATASTPLDGRLSPANDGTWDPIVVLHPTSQAPGEAQRLLAMAHAGHAVSAIVGYPTGDRWQLQVHDNTIRIEPLGQTFRRRNLTSEEQTAVADLVAAAKDPEGIPADLAEDPLAEAETPVDTIDPWQEPVEQTLFADEQTSACDTPAAAPEMKLLGTIRVDGIDGNFPYLRCTEVVAYLTFHRNGVEADTLMEALWPEEPPDNRRLNRHTSATRSVLGAEPDGTPYLPYIGGGLYRISPHIRNDLEHFTNHIRQADRATGDEQAGHLRAALELVEGTPFSGAGNGYIWAHTDGTITHTIVAIDNAAHRLAQHALDNDDPDEATWAARKGLLATGACEACYRNLMRAAAAEGNQVAFEATYRELLAVTDADEGPDATTYLDPETIDLYEQESRGRRRQVG